AAGQRVVEGARSFELFVLEDEDPSHAPRLARLQPGRKTSRPGTANGGPSDGIQEDPWHSARTSACLMTSARSAIAPSSLPISDRAASTGAWTSRFRSPGRARR